MTREEKTKLYQKWYCLSQRGKEARRRYAQSEKGRLSNKRCQARYMAKLKRLAGMS